MTRNNDTWVRCPECGHKLFKIVRNGSGEAVQIETKCHSCKNIITIEIKSR